MGGGEEVIEGEFTHVTSGGNRFEIKYKANLIDINDVPYDPDIRNLCLGCENYGKKKSCPPFAKRFEDFMEDYNTMLVFALIVDIEQAMRQFKKPRSYMGYLILLDRMIRNMITKITRNIESKFDGYALLEGACKLCNKCGFKKKSVCDKPEKVRPSLEASGINVAELTEKALNHVIQWYARDVNVIPDIYFKYINKSNIHNSIDYLTKTTGILLSDDSPLVNITIFLHSAIKEVS